MVQSMALNILYPQGGIGNLGSFIKHTTNYIDFRLCIVLFNFWSCGAYISDDAWGVA